MSACRPTALGANTITQLPGGTWAKAIAYTVAAGVVVGTVHY
jgi:hypothetical protein